MFLPIRTDAPIRHQPWMNWLLIFGNVVAFVAQRNLWPAGQTPTLMLDPDGVHLLHFFTYQFLHGDAMHLIGNMLFLYIFGNNINDRLGHVGYLAFYLAGGVIAGIGHLLTSSVPVLGASGSVAAVTGAFLVLFPRSYVTVIYLFIFIGSFQIWSMYLIGFFFVKDLFLNFLGSTGVAHMAHIAGTVFGFGISFGLLYVGLLPRDLYDLPSLLDRWNRRRAHRTAVSRGYDPFGHGQLTSRQAPVDPFTQQIMEMRAAISEAMAHHQPERAAQLYLDLKARDPTQVLSRQTQHDIATQLAHQQLFPQAAEAYESLLNAYPRAEQAPQVRLMLGLIYARYLQQPEPARQHLAAFLESVQDGREADLAREELARLSG